MKKNIFLLGLFMLTFTFFYGQVPKEFPRQEYKFSQQIKKELVQEELRSARASWHYSYISKYQEAMDCYSAVDNRHGFDQLSEADSLYFLEFEALDAVDFILQRAKDERIIIINEAHHKPQHRAFARSLLPGIYEAGFRYLGLECLTPNPFKPDGGVLITDTLLNERGYPYQSYFTGTYTTEPQMGHLVRDGIEAGFEFFAYERYKKGDREQMQAENIQRILDKDSTAKILIFCGLDHVLEDTIHTSGKPKWMAWHLKQMTGIDPWTINQDLLTEGKQGAEAKLYTLIDEEKPSLFLNTKGEVYSGPEDWKKVDALLYHPRSKYTKNRPDWLLNVAGNQLYELNKSEVEISYPVLVKAYHPEEQESATPWDVIELANAQDETALVLPKGEYVLKLINPDGAEQALNISVE